jgi:hypothetical protein
MNYYKQLVNIFFKKKILFFNKPKKVKVKDEEDENTYYPNKSGLIVNALIATLEDENTLVRRAGLDFLISHFDILTDTFS